MATTRSPRRVELVRHWRGKAARQWRAASAAADSRWEGMAVSWSFAVNATSLSVQRLLPGRKGWHRLRLTSSVHNAILHRRSTAAIGESPHPLTPRRRNDTIYHKCGTARDEIAPRQRSHP